MKSLVTEGSSVFKLCEALWCVRVIHSATNCPDTSLDVYIRDRIGSCSRTEVGKANNIVVFRQPESFDEDKTR